MNTSAASVSPAPRPATSASSDASHMSISTDDLGGSDLSKRNPNGDDVRYYRAWVSRTTTQVSTDPVLDDKEIRHETTAPHPRHDGRDRHARRVRVERVQRVVRRS